MPNVISITLNAGGSNLITGAAAVQAQGPAEAHGSQRALDAGLKRHRVVVADVDAKILQMLLFRIYFIFELQSRLIQGVQILTGRKNWVSEFQCFDSVNKKAMSLKVSN